jgi:hypothetical protein
MEATYPGVTAQIERFERQVIPACPRCFSDDTALVQVGFVGHLAAISAATSKVAIVLNGPRPGKYKCHRCGTFFNDASQWTTRH